MKQIEEFSRKGLRNNECLAYYREVEAAILKETAEKLHVEKQFVIFQGRLQAFDDTIVRILGNAITELMAQTDGGRDNLIVGSWEHIRAGKRHFDPEIVQAANDLTGLMKTFQGIDKKGYDEETGYVTNMVEACRKEPNKSNLAKLNLTEWIDKLEQLNNKCIELTKDRTVSDNEKAAAGCAVDARKVLKAEYDELIKLLNALAIVNGEELYADLFDYINGRIAHYRNVLARRSGKGGGGSGNSGNDE